MLVGVVKMPHCWKLHVAAHVRTKMARDSLVTSITTIISTFRLISCIPALNFTCPMP